MIEVKVKYVGYLAMAAGRDGKILEIEEGRTLYDLLALLAEKEPNDHFRSCLFDRRGTLEKTIMVMIDDRLIENEKLSFYRLKTDCLVRLVPIVVGG